MCGRFTQSSSFAEIAAALGVAQIVTEESRPRYNIAPTQDVAAVRETSGERELRMLRWGLVPAWSKDVEIGSRLINARAETVTEKPSFREAFKRRRCLIPSEGFYEWKREGTRKQPYYFRMKDKRPFAFAGLWERWEGHGQKVIETCTILTTEANEVLAPVHDRMPVIIAAEHYESWLDPHLSATERLLPLLRPYGAAEMTSFAVSVAVNSPRAEGAGLIAPFVNSQ
ncbi:MAG: SOS response-associated peptidase [Acidobacteriota bacterium]|nr:SOS response-associated peptidase [Acidobacteriota bacterium]